MLAPNLAKAKTDLISTVSAAQVITRYAGAMRFCVGPQLQSGLPAWFDPVKAHLTAAIGHATSWMDDLCIDLTSAIPQDLIDFNTQFQSVSDDLINLTTEIMMTSGAATDTQRADVIALYKKIADAVAPLSTRMASYDRRLGGLAANVQADYDALSKDSVLIADHIADADVMTKQISAALGDNYMQITPQGQCMVAIAIKRDVTLKITALSGTHTELLPMLIAQNQMANLLQDNAQATLAFSAIGNLWAYMGGLVDTAIKDLAKATDKDVIGVLQDAEFSAAQSVWANLALDAQSLLNPTTFSPTPQTIGT